MHLISTNLELYFVLDENKSHTLRRKVGEIPFWQIFNFFLEWEDIEANQAVENTYQNWIYCNNLTDIEIKLIAFLHSKSYYFEKQIIISGINIFVNFKENIIADKYLNNELSENIKSKFSVSSKIIIFKR
jgi:hypothetical protein